MKFRPCIDIHNGKVKQIVGGSLKDGEDLPKENFVSEKDASYYAGLYKENNQKGGHVILLDPPGSEHYEETRRQAVMALQAYPLGMMVGGGITPKNATFFLDMGASHVIVTSYVFQDGKLHYDKLREMIKTVSKKRLVLDLSCRKKGGQYYIVTNRWQKYTDIRLDGVLLHELEKCCDEFLVHGVDVEGKSSGIEEEVVRLLGENCNIPVTYAGGVHDLEDLKLLRELGKDKVDVTIGSALDLFGGPISYREVTKLLK